MADKSTSPWAEYFTSASADLENAIAAAKAVEDWIRNYLVGVHRAPRESPPNVQEQLMTLHRSLDAARATVAELSERIRFIPVNKRVLGRRLSREEYFVLLAQGVALGSHKDLGLSKLDDYEVFDMFFYEDDERLGYINPSPPGTATLPNDVHPEEISFDRLRPEQRVFFDKHLPAVGKRFKRHA